MTEKEKIRYIEFLRLETRLRDASLNGASLVFEGHCCSAETIASVCVFSDNGYYMDESRNSPGEGADVIILGLDHGGK